MGSLEGLSMQAAALDHHTENHAGSAGCALDGWQRRSWTSAQRTKVKEILACCHDREKNNHLTQLATSARGLVDDEVRRLACMFGPSLLGNPS